MRFAPDGPSIPDQLLNARDEGRVVFFCGAGVSFAKIKLPNFLELTQRVIEQLGVGDDESVYKLLRADQQIQVETGVSLLSMDRIFGLLERDFTDTDIKEAVAFALKPDPDPDLSAHKTLLNLATTPEGNVQLITTNFDRLFEECDDSVKFFAPPKLPATDDLDGIVHLHGIVTPEYNSSEGDGFVLSSSEFGHAYLAEGWATEFMKTILDKYTVVFVGYTADDPPVRYLLEALSKRTHSIQGMYAFHEDSKRDAQAAWASKGVEPIVYNGFDLLWESMDLWAERAIDQEAWKQSILEKALNGPNNLHDYERGQVAHVVSTTDGMRKVSTLSETFPAEWICVFDPYLRYTSPLMEKYWDVNSNQIRPFDRYALDSDSRIVGDPDEVYQEQKIPLDAWNCFSLLTTDTKDLNANNFPTFTGHYSQIVPPLTGRLQYLENWIIQVAEHPITIWWAVKRGGLHPNVLDKILDRFKRENNYVVRNIWQDLSKYWKHKKSEFEDRSYEIEEILKQEPCSKKVIKTLVEYYKPTPKVEVGFGYQTFPPINSEEKIPEYLLNFEVNYERIIEFKIPDEYLTYFINEFRYVLEEAVLLEDTFDIWSKGIDPINKEADPHNEIIYDDTLSTYVHYFVDLLQRLIVLDPILVKKEFSRWDSRNSLVFSELTIWICSEEQVVSGEEAGHIILEVENDFFWDSRVQRDLLITLEKRWNHFDPSTKKLLQKRLLKGRKKFDYEEENEYLETNASVVLSRIYWLDEHECSFDFDLENESKRLMAAAPHWKHEYAKKADQSLQGRGGLVRTDSDHNVLLKIPLALVLKKAIEMKLDRDEFLNRLDPYKGLVEKRPLRAFSALTLASKAQDYPEWAWNTFFYAGSRNLDSTRFMSLIALRVLNIPLEDLKKIIHSLIYWFNAVSKKLLEVNSKLFYAISNKIIELLTVFPEVGVSTITTNSKIYEWLDHARDTPEGKLVNIWMDLSPVGLKAGEKFPEDWLAQIEQLLHLIPEINRFVLVMLTRNINWFYRIDPEWTKKNLLIFLEQSEEDKDAFFAGFFRSQYTPDIELYNQVKPYILEFFKKGNVKRSINNRLAAMLLVGWGTIDNLSGERLITNKEMRTILIEGNEDFHMLILSNILRWLRNNEGDWDKKIQEFLQLVWPRHKKVKSKAVLAQLCNLALLKSDVFPIVVDDVIRLVKSASVGRISLPNLRQETISAFDTHPEKVLELLFTVLATNLNEWPYGINKALQKIIAVDPELSKDRRFIELHRRWNSR